MTSFQIPTNIKTDWIENRNGFRSIKELDVFFSPTLDLVHITGIGVSGKKLRGLIGITPDIMDNLVRKWCKARAEVRKDYVWVVEHQTLCDGWVNTWTVSDDDDNMWPEVFLTKEDAEAELKNFLDDMNNDPERTEEERYSSAEFRVQMVPRSKVSPESIVLMAPTGAEGYPVTYELIEVRDYDNS